MYDVIRVKYFFRKGLWLLKACWQRKFKYKAIGDSDSARTRPCEKKIKKKKPQQYKIVQPFEGFTEILKETFPRYIFYVQYWVCRIFISRSTVYVDPYYPKTDCHFFCSPHARRKYRQDRNRMMALRAILSGGLQRSEHLRWLHQRWRNVRLQTEITTLILTWSNKAQNAHDGGNMSFLFPSPA